jgi:hypothetical protein
MLNLNWHDMTRLMLITLKITCSKKKLEIRCLCWFFYVNDNKDVDLKCLQTMKCILCYNTTNRRITSKEHVNANHFIVAKIFEEEIYNPLKKEVER